MLDLFAAPDMPTHMLGIGAPPLTMSWDRFSDDRTKRFLLEYWWDRSLPALMCCGQNPSRATRQVADHTVKVVARRAHRTGHGGLVMMNLFPEVATDPADLWAMGDALDQSEGTNLDVIAVELRECGPVSTFLFAPGCDPNPRHRARALTVEKLVRRTGRDLMCLGVTAAGLPRHPSRLGYDVRMVLWHGSFANV